MTLAACEASITERILDSFPSGSYALSALLRLMDVVESDSVPTAAVECRIQPVLRINPEFARAHAETPEKLMMLVMHELHHILLGHTTLFPHPTPVLNFVFDAVINGLLCRMFPEAAYTSFLTDFYSADTFPECLLRPAPEWPADPEAIAPAVARLAGQHRRLAREVHTALYSETGASYDEVYDSLPKVLVDMGGLDPLEGIPLLGDHRDEGSPSDLENRSPLLFDAVRGLVEQWPQPPDPIKGRSLADVINASVQGPERVPSNRCILRGLIMKIAIAQGAGRVRRLGTGAIEIDTPVPTLARRSLVMRALGAQPLLYPGSAPVRRRVNAGERVHVYLDVSGSMTNVLGPLFGAVLDCAELVHPTIHMFSTEVVDVSLTALRRGDYQSTGGTDIDCVAEHMASNRVTRALIITDGWVGVPGGGIHATLASARLAVAYLGGATNSEDLSSVANHTACLEIGDSR